MKKRVFNKDKTQELTDYDLSLGRLKEDKLLIAHHDAVAEKTATEVAAELSAQGKTVERVADVWYEIIGTYPNGGKDLRAIQSVAAQEEWDEYEDIYVYIPYSESELVVIAAKKAISEAKLYLRETDYIVLKIAEAVAEGDASEVTALQAEYAEQLSKRKQARAAVNANEESIIALQKGV